MLTEHEKSLQSYYSHLLNLCNREKALSEGQYYGLQYANPHCDKYDSNHIFSYLRGTENELLLVVANFSGCDKDCEVTIPEEAFAFFGAAYDNETHKVKELISGKSIEIFANPHDKVAITVPANNGVIIRIK